MKVFITLFLLYLGLMLAWGIAELISRLMGRTFSQVVASGILKIGTARRIYCRYLRWRISSHERVIASAKEQLVVTPREITVVKGYGGFTGSEYEDDLARAGETWEDTRPNPAYVRTEERIRDLRWEIKDLEAKLKSVSVEKPD